VSADAACCAACGIALVSCARNPCGHANSNANVANANFVTIAACFDQRAIMRCSSRFFRLCGDVPDSIGGQGVN
jgi:hypothetical protein